MAAGESARGAREGNEEGASHGVSRLWFGALLLVPAGYGAHWLDAAPLVVFTIAGVAIVPLAQWIRYATEHLSERAGPAIGGLLNVTFGNVAELTLALFVLATGHAAVVKGQITGSIIGNSLLGLGLAIVVGTFGRDNLRFKRERVGLLSSLLVLVSIALLVPALFDYTERGLYAARDASQLDERLSLGVAVVMLFVYAANLVYTLVTDRDVFALDEYESHARPWPLWQSLAVLIAATAATALMADLVSGALTASASALHVSTYFLGVVVLALLGNAAEYLSALFFARKGRMGLVMTLTVGSTIQVALVVAPVLVLVSLLLGSPMNLVFTNPIELIAIASVAFAVNSIAQDGETSWFEGLLLCALYCLFALAFFFATPPNVPA